MPHVDRLTEKSRLQILAPYKFFQPSVRTLVPSLSYCKKKKLQGTMGDHPWHGVSSCFNADTLLLASAQYLSTHYFGVRFHVVTPRCDRWSGFVFKYFSLVTSVVVIHHILLLSGCIPNILDFAKGSFLPDRYLVAEFPHRSQISLSFQPS